jgi:hypothetical protein
MAGFTSGRTKSKKRIVEPLDYHEGLSINQVKIILRELNLDLNKFDKWMYGQTCPIVHRTNDVGLLVEIGGIYEYDLFRWIENQKKGTPLIWD